MVELYLPIASAGFFRIFVSYIALTAATATLWMAGYSLTGISFFLTIYQ
jgi:hypothetical protein